MSKYTTTTNSAGIAEFEVEYDTYTVTITKDGFKTVTLDVPFSEDSKEFRVTFEHIQDTELTIEVQDDGGIGIPGANVKLVGDVTFEDITDSSGKAYFEIPYGDYAATVSKDGYITITEDIVFSEDQKTFTVTLETVPKPQLTIFVSDENAQPAEGALVTITETMGDEEQSATTDEDGKVIFDVDYGDYTVTTTKDGYKTSTEDIVFNEDHTTFNITLEPTPQTDTLRITVSDTEDEVNSLVEGATVTVRKGSVEYTTTTGQDGVAEFQVEYGDYTATISKEGYYPATESIAFRSNHKNFNITISAIHEDVMTLVWDSSKSATINTNLTDGEGIIISIEATGTIDWGDGTTSTFRYPSDFEHTYETEDVYTVNMTLHNGTVESISRRCFYRDDEEEQTALKSIIFPLGLLSIEEEAFKYCRGLETVTFHPNEDMLSHIEGYAFYRCESLTSISLPDSILQIGQNCFEYCTSLSNVKLSSNMSTIPNSCFESCTSLTSFRTPRNISTIDTYCFSGCTSLQEFRGTVNLLDIEPYAFYDCTSLENVTLYGETNFLGDYAFARCTSLEHITLPESIEYISDSLFEQSGLVHITIPDNVQGIGEAAFAECVNLGTVNITSDSNVTELGNYCFEGCGSLNNVILPDGVTSVGDSAFASCTSLTNISLPDTITSLGSSCFTSCTNLSRIHIPPSLTVLADDLFYECSSLTSITIPSGITSLGVGCFQNCSALTSITLPNTVLSVGNYCFAHCTALSDINMPKRVTSLGNCCFSECTITSLDVPATVDSMSNIILNCSNLTVLNLDWVGRAILSFSGSFDDNLNWNNITINIPAGSFDDYVNKGYPEGSLHDNRLRS